MSDSPLPLSTISPKYPVREWGIAAFVSLCVSLAVVAPFFRLGTASGHDVAFHMASWLDVAGQWKQGILFPRWAEFANFAFGEPRFIFYPPLSWLFGAFLGTFLPWQSVAVVFIVCVETFAGLSGYALLRQLADSRFAALFGAACFAANPYSLLIIYMRSDFAELLAVAIFPLLILATFELLGLLHGGKSGSFRTRFLFAVTFCAVWLSNAPAAVIATYSVAFLFVLAALRQRSFSPLGSGAAGMALGFGLASFYLIPAVYEQRWVNISGALSEGLTPAENFLYAKTTDNEHDAFNRIASNIAVLLIFWALFAAVTAWRKTFAAKPDNRAAKHFLAIAVLSAAATVLMLPITLVFWRFLPELHFVQFPWRWMSVLALCATIFTAATARGWLRFAWLLLAMLAFAGSAHYLVKNAWWDTEDMPDLQAAMRNGSGFEGTDEYDPVGDDRTDLPQKQPRALLLAIPTDPETYKDARVSIEKWNAEHRSIRVVTRRAGRLALHLLDYPAWRVTLNGKPVSIQHSKGTEQMIIPVPAGESELKIDFTRTTDRALGGWISVGSLAASMTVLFWKRRMPPIPGA
jgi:6-pyruvoyl-tetrahydropterin synthase related domain